MCLLLRPASLPLVALAALLERLAAHALPPLVTPARGQPLTPPVWRPLTPLLTCLWLGRAAFFLHGGSNSLATLDVGVGYLLVHQYK